MTLTPYHDARAAVWHGDCLDLMRALPEGSVDSIITDPPYGLGFMGKKWDDLPPGEEWARECLRVLKPGGHLLAFGGTRTWHRLAVAVEDGGFEIRDSIAWLYGSGFPKSLNVAKAIASGGGQPQAIRKLAMGKDYEPSGRGRVNYDHGGGSAMNGSTADVDVPPEAEQWQGWGTALKPAFEPIVVGRKPLVGTVAANVLAYGTGALNVDGCRIEGPGGVERDGEASQETRYTDSGATNFAVLPGPRGGSPAGRWPANAVLDESQAEALDEQSGTLKSGANPTRRGSDKFRDTYGDFKGQEACTPARGVDVGGASRFFYCAKAPSKERVSVEIDGQKFSHPTVKPLTLMRWLVRLVTPPGGLVLDPFGGSGTTGEAALLEGFRVLMAENDTENHHIEMIAARMARVVLPEAA